VIGSLRGVVLERGAGEALLEVGGVGYRVLLPAGDALTLRLGEEAFVYVHTHVREDALTLFAFATREGRDLFEILIGAHGVGPGLALAILSALRPAALRRAVAAGDTAALTQVPGVGAKTAARLVLELASRVGSPAGTTDEPGPQPGDQHGSALSELRVALAGLGYGPDEVRHALADLPADASLEELLRLALRSLAAVSR